MKTPFVSKGVNKKVVDKISKKKDEFSKFDSIVIRDDTFDFDSSPTPYVFVNDFVDRTPRMVKKEILEVKRPEFVPKIQKTKLTSRSKKALKKEAFARFDKSGSMVPMSIRPKFAPRPKKIRHVVATHASRLPHVVFKQKKSITFKNIDVSKLSIEFVPKKTLETILKSTNPFDIMSSYNSKARDINQPLINVFALQALMKNKTYKIALLKSVQSKGFNDVDYQDLFTSFVDSIGKSEEPSFNEIKDEMDKPTAPVVIASDTSDIVIGGVVMNNKIIGRKLAARTKRRREQRHAVKLAGREKFKLGSLPKTSVIQSDLNSISWGITAKTVVPTGMTKGSATPIEKHSKDFVPVPKVQNVFLVTPQLVPEIPVQLKKTGNRVHPKKVKRLARRSKAQSLNAAVLSSKEKSHNAFVKSRQAREDRRDAKKGLLRSEAMVATPPGISTMFELCKTTLSSNFSIGAVGSLISSMKALVDACKSFGEMVSEDIFKTLVSTMIVIYQIFRAKSFIDVASAVTQFGIAISGGSVIASLTKHVDTIMDTVFANPLRKEAASDTMFTIAGMLDCLVNSAFAVSIQRMVLSVVSTKILSKDVAHQVTKIFGSIPKGGYTVMETLCNILQGVGVMLKFSEAFMRGVPFLDAIMGDDPVRTITSEARALLGYKDLTYPGLPVEGRMCRRVFRIKCKDYLLIVKDLIENTAMFGARKTAMVQLARDLSAALNEIDMALRANKRVTPIGFVVNGPPKIGKGNILELPMRVHSKVKGRKFDPQQVFTKNPDTEFWDGIVPGSHPYIHFSEVANQHVRMAKALGDKVMTQLNSLIDCRPFPANMAFGDKGKVYLDPEMVIIDTNNREMHIAETMYCASAMFRRFYFLDVEVLNEFREMGLNETLSTAIDSAKSHEAGGNLLDRYRFTLTAYSANGRKPVPIPLYCGRIEGLIKALEVMFKRHIAEGERMIKDDIFDFVDSLLEPVVEKCSVIDDLLFFDDDDMDCLSPVVLVDEKENKNDNDNNRLEAKDEFVQSKTHWEILENKDLSHPAVYENPERNNVDNAAILKDILEANKKVKSDREKVRLQDRKLYQTASKLMEGAARIWSVGNTFTIFSLWATMHIFMKLPIYGRGTLFFKTWCTSWIAGSWYWFGLWTPISVLLFAFTTYVDLSSLGVPWLGIIFPSFVAPRLRIYFDAQRRRAWERFKYLCNLQSEYHPYITKRGKIIADALMVLTGFLAIYLAKKAYDKSAPEEERKNAVREHERFGIPIPDIHKESILHIPESKVPDFEEGMRCEARGDDEILKAIEEDLSIGTTRVRFKLNDSERWGVQESMRDLSLHKGDPKSLAVSISNSLFRVRVISRGSSILTHMWGVKGTYFIINKHAIKDLSDICLEISQEYHMNPPYTLSRVFIGELDYVDMGSDLILLNIPTKNVKDRSKHLFSGVLPENSEGFFNIAPVTVRYETGFLDLPEDNFDGLDGYVAYQADHAVGMCGIPVIAKTDYYGSTIVGIHSMGNQFNQNCYASLLQRDHVLKCIDELVRKGLGRESFSMSQFDFVLLPPIHKSLFKYEYLPYVNYYGRIPGDINMNKSSRLSQNSYVGSIKDLFKREFDFTQTGFYGRPLMKPMTVESVYKSPYNNHMRSLNKNPVCLDQKVLKKVVQVYAEHILRGLRSKGITQISPISLDQAINGVEQDDYINRVNSTTCAGFGFEGKKSLYVPLDRDENGELTTHRSAVPLLKKKIICMVDGYAHRLMYMTIYQNQLKDEARPLEKIRDGKTRNFGMGSLEVLTLMRMILGPVLSLEVENREIFQTCVGINMHTQSGRLVSQFQSFASNIMEGDYKGYDINTPIDIGRATNEVIHLVAEGLGYNQKSLLLLDGLLFDSLYPFFLMNQDLFMKPGMLPSGMYGTAEINSLRGVIMFMHFWYSHPFLKSLDFFDYVLMRTYGDDVLAAVKDAVAEYFNNHTYAVFCSAKYDMEFTSANKTDKLEKFLSVREMSFLKRTFHKFQDTATVVGRLDMNSILKSLEWTIPSPFVTRREQITQTFASALRELFFYSKDQLQYERLYHHFADVLAEEFGGHPAEFSLPEYHEIYSSVF